MPLRAQEEQMETAVQVRQSINVTAVATLLVALFAAVMGRELNAAMLAMAGVALVAAARQVVVSPPRPSRSTATDALCAHL
jgi:hypothetical protein